MLEWIIPILFHATCIYHKSNIINSNAVSAIFVANTTFRTPFGGRVKTRRCSSGGIVKCMGRTLSRSAGNVIDFTSNYRSVVMSLIPGRKTRMAKEVVSIILESPSFSLFCCCCLLFVLLLLLFKALFFELFK